MCVRRLLNWRISVLPTGNNWLSMILDDDNRSRTLPESTKGWNFETNILIPIFWDCNFLSYFKIRISAENQPPSDWGFNSFCNFWRGWTCSWVAPLNYEIVKTSNSNYQFSLLCTMKKKRFMGTLFSAWVLYQFVRKLVLYFFIVCFFGGGGGTDI